MVRQFLPLLQSIYAASCKTSEQRSMSVQFLSLEDDPFTDQLSELFAAFAAEQLGAPVCLMSFDTDNRIKVANYGAFTERHPLRSAPVATISDERVIDLAERSRTDGQTIAGVNRTGGDLATVDQDPDERLSDSIERERSQAALLVVNARPISRSIESLMTSRKVDGVVMIIDAGETEAKAAIAACDKVAAVGGRILGVVLKESAESGTMPLKLPWNGLSIMQWLPAGAIIAGLTFILICFAVVASIPKVPADGAIEPASQSASSTTTALPKPGALPWPSPALPEVGR